MSPRVVAALCLAMLPALAEKPSSKLRFQTSDRCLACHNGLQTSSGEDVSIGYDWRSSMMANSSRDPYWQASVRREAMDHAGSKADIEDECSVCHMPITRYEAKLKGRKGEVFAHLPFDLETAAGRQAADGVSCSVCHQIGKQKLGTRESFNGGFVVDEPDSRDKRPEYGPFEIENGHARIMRTSSEGFQPTKVDHIRQSELCATCHTLYTSALGPDGKVIGELPEQMPYQEWLASDYKDKKSCQSCHMPVIPEAVPITRVLGTPREGAARHVFVGANFTMLRLLNRFRDELSVRALPQELSAAAGRTVQFLQSETARITIGKMELSSGHLVAEVIVENLSGHKLPTGYPARRAWLHVTFRDRNRRTIFESGRLRTDGSIEGNVNDIDATAFEPHFDEIRTAGQVQIYESIMADSNGAVTTGLLTAVRYAKDNRLLPHGFEKQSANRDIAVVGEAAGDADFNGSGDRVKYSVAVAGAEGPIEVEAELLFQPIGYRWANNLKKYDATETRRFNTYFDAMSAATSTALARTVRSHP